MSTTLKRAELGEFPVGEDVGSRLGSRGLNSRVPRINASSAPETVIALSQRNFKIDTNAAALVSKRAGRTNAAAVSNEEIDALHAERRQMLALKMERNLSRAESARLAYVRWSLVE